MYIGDMKKGKLLPLILLASPLLLANSPAPFASPDHYDDYAITNITYKESVQVPGSYLFSLEVTNLGDGYLELVNLLDYRFTIFNQYYDLYLRPHEKTIVRGRTDKQYQITQLDTEGFGFTNYISLSEYKFTNTSSPEKDEGNEEENHCYYYGFEAKYTLPSNDYHYSMLIDYTIKDKKYTQYYSYDTEIITLISEDNVAAEEIHIDGLSVIRGRYSAGTKFNATAYILIAILAIGMILLFGGIIVAIILMPIILI